MTKQYRFETLQVHAGQVIDKETNAFIYLLGNTICTTSPLQY
ncbi:hypothetical protein [Macrococcoides bohemicum]|nr:hypothetical protein [Macrococcus bohemicus]